MGGEPDDPGAERAELDPRKVLEQARADRAAESAARGGFRPPPVDELAACFPGLEFRGLVGRGGMGAVYRARSRELGRDVAVKILPRALADRDPAFAERFAREARALALLEHPHVLRVLDSGEVDGWFYLTTEFVEGADLRQMMRLGRITPDEALRLVPQLCDALAFAHGRGVVHRDIKPENILVDAHGDAKVADFGLARILGEAASVCGGTLTGTGQVLGTPHYMAPEQIDRPTRVDHRADLYSLAVVVYELLTGELPLGRFDAPSTRSRGAERFDAPVMRSLARDPERRHQSAADLRRDLERGATQGAERARPGRGGARGPAASRRAGLEAQAHRAVLLLLLATLGVLTGVLTNSAVAVFAGAVVSVFASRCGFGALRTVYRDAAGGWLFVGVVAAAWMPPLVLAAWTSVLVVFAAASGLEVDRGFGWRLLGLGAAAVLVVLGALVGDAFRSRAGERVVEPSAAARPGRAVPRGSRGRARRATVERWFRLALVAGLVAAFVVFLTTMRR